MNPNPLVKKVLSTEELPKRSKASEKRAMLLESVKGLKQGTVLELDAALLKYPTTYNRFLADFRAKIITLTQKINGKPQKRVFLIKIAPKLTEAKTQSSNQKQHEPVVA